MSECELNALVQSLTAQIARLALELAQRDARLAVLEAEESAAEPGRAAEADHG